MANVTRVNLTDRYAIAVEAVAKQLGVSQAEVCRMGLRALWGENLENAPVNGSTVQPVNLSQVQPVVTALPAVTPPTLDDLFTHSA
jgi:hypothetical protein